MRLLYVLGFGPAARRTCRGGPIYFLVRLVFDLFTGVLDPLSGVLHVLARTVSAFFGSVASDQQRAAGEKNRCDH